MADTARSQSYMSACVHTHLLPFLLLWLSVGQLEPQRDALVGAHQHAQLVAAEEGVGDVGAEEDPFPAGVGDGALCVCLLG